jgi:hypothetical protein
MDARAGILALLAMLAGGASAYGPGGHQMVGAIADTQLSAAARAAVAKISASRCAPRATWAGCARTQT